MSGSREIAENAVTHINQLIAEMLEGGHDDNEVALGRILCGGQEMQIQLKVTAVRNDFLYDDEEDLEP